MDRPVDGTTVIRASGRLDAAGGARLLRVLDAQIEMARGGHRRLDAVVVDISAVDTIGRGGPEALAHAQYACSRRRIEFVMGGAVDLWSLSPAARRRLGALTWYPTVDLAVASVGGGAADHHG